MKIHGNRIYLILPPMPDTKIELDPKTKRELESEMMGKYDRLVVYDVGVGNGAESGIVNSTNEIKPGDEVFADPNALRRGVMLTIDGKNLISISKSDIMHTW